jgi:signal peptidase II
LTKYIVRASIDEGKSIVVIDHFFKITHIENEGAAFGIMSGERRFLLVVPVIVIIVALFILIRHRTDEKVGKISKAAILMVLSGGIGNLIDRIIFGTVTDMLSFSIFPPVFNVADIFVTVGAALFVFAVLKGDIKYGKTL